MRFRFVAIFVFAYVAIVGLESVAVRAKAAGDAAPAGCRLPFDIACTFLGGRHEDPEVKAVADQVDDTEAVTLANLERHPARDPYHQIVTLGKLELYDKSLSVNKNIACASCHVPQTGFTSGVQLYNETIVAQPGSVPITDVSGMHPNWRIGPRKPMSYAYAPFSPVLHYVADQKTFVGGNFWDMRATGYRLQNPAAEQAQDPPTNPNEMADPDSACVVYSLSKAPEAYRHLFVQLWGAQSFAIHWPQNVERVCAMPASSHVDNPTALRLGRVDRGISDSTYEHFADAIAAFEASPEVSPFSSKFDAFLAGNVALDPAERRGYQLFNGQARCSQCHVDGSIGGGATIKYGKILLASATGPLFTDETSANLGIPKNDDSPYLYEDVPDQHGYVANSAGPSHLDLGVGAFLAGNLNPNPGTVEVARADVLWPDSCGDATQRRQAPLPELRESLHAQRLLEEPGRSRPFLQHARRLAALPFGRFARRRKNVLAGAGVPVQPQSPDRQPRAQCGAGIRCRRVLENANGWVRSLTLLGG